MRILEIGVETQGALSRFYLTYSPVFGRKNLEYVLEFNEEGKQWAKKGH
jgi:hypothetical protein